MSSTYGEQLKLSIFGASHAPSIGMTLENIPAGLSVDTEALQEFLNRRAPGRNEYSTPRKEDDRPEFLSGIVNGQTDGTPITGVIYNKNTRSGDYDDLKDCPRPGHADYTAHMKYGESYDHRGGGQFSGRLTAAMCIAGGLCKKWLEEKGIFIHAHILRIGDIWDTPFDPLAPALTEHFTTFPTLSPEAGQRMRALIAQVREEKDSIGGMVECAVTGLPAGLGGPLFAGMEGKLSSILFGIPAVKAVEFGAGTAVAALRGSENNDAFLIKDGEITTATNNAGGILGGITNGMPLLLRASFKPTPSIGMQQKTVRLSTMEEVTMTVTGRHDPCIVPRAVPVVEAAAAIAIFDALLAEKSQ